MDIWQELYEKARAQYGPQEVSPFVYAHHVVCALESENGGIYTGFCIESCSGVMDAGCSSCAAFTCTGGFADVLCAPACAAMTRIQTFCACLQSI